MPTDASNKEIYFIPIRKPKCNAGLIIIIIIIQLHNYVIHVISFFHLVLPVMCRFHPI